MQVQLLREQLQKVRNVRKIDKHTLVNVVTISCAAAASHRMRLEGKSTCLTKPQQQQHEQRHEQQQKGTAQQMWKEKDLGEVRGAGVLDLADVLEHGHPVFMVEGRVTGRHFKD